MSKSKEEYIRKVENTPEIPVFYQPWWLDAVAGEDGWDAVVSYDKENNITGIWSFSTIRQIGFSFSRAFKLTPFSGPYLFYPKQSSHPAKQLSFEKKTLIILAKQIKKKKFLFFNQYSSPFLNNTQPLLRSGFKSSVVYRSVLRTQHSKEQLFSNLKRDKKHRINRFKKYGKITQEINPSLLYNFITASYNRRKQKPAYSLSLYKNLTHHSIKNHAGIMLFAYNEKSQPVGGCFLVKDAYRYYMINTGMPTLNNDALSALIWESILLAKDEEKDFDFCGSMIPGISDFFQSFGANQECYQQLSWYTNRFIYALNQLRK